MAKKTQLFRGLDVRTNRLLVEGNTARDCSNVRLDFNNKLIKREEFSALDLPFDLTDDPTLWDDELPTDSEILDIVEFEGKFILFLKHVPISGTSQTDFVNSLYEYDVDTDTLTAIPCNTSGDFDEAGYGGTENVTFDGKITTFEKLGNLYFQGSSNSNTNTDHNGDPLLCKYDGKVWHAAGVNPISSTITNDPDEGTLTGSDYYVRSVPMHIDNQGNQIFGEWRVEKVVTGGSDISGFRAYHNSIVNYNTANVTGTSPSQNITDSSLTIDVVSSDSVSPGQVLMIMDKSIYRLYRFTVASTTTGTVTFTEPKVYQDGSWLDAGTFSVTLGALSYMSNTILLSYFSQDYSVGYVFGDMGISSRSGIGDLVIDYDPASPNTVPDWSLFTTNFEDFYGAEIKGNPPPATQVREYGDSILLTDGRFLYFSDLSLNGTVENFTAFDFFPVGEEERGDIVSFFSNETFIAVFRERESYLVYGNIFTGNYRVQSYRSTRIGGSSPTAVMEVDGQCLLVSSRGPDIAQENATFSRIGDRIEPIFTEGVLGLNPSLSSAKMVLDATKEVVYISFESGNGSSDDFIILYDYRNKEWFKYSSLNARGGMAIRRSTGKFYYSDGSDLYEEQASYSTGVSSTWKSNFESLGMASLKKRFQRLTLFISSRLSTSIGFKAYKNWDESTAYTDVTMTTSSGEPLDTKKLDPKLTYSTSFEITSSGTNEFKVDGFEYGYEDEQGEVNDSVRG